MARLNVFISGRTTELHDERIGVSNLILDFLKDNVDVFVFEKDAGARTESPDEAYSQEVRNCDIYIGIFKEEYSKATEKGYHIAFNNKKEILIFVTNFDVKERDSRLQKLIDQFKEHHTYKDFDSVDDLKAQVHKSIANMLVTSLRNKRLFDISPVQNHIVNFSKELTDAVPEEGKVNLNHADTWYFRGNVLANLGRREEAVDSYDAAVKVNPNHTDAWYYRGNTLAQLGMRWALVVSCSSYSQTIHPTGCLTLYASTEDKQPKLFPVFRNNITHS